MILIYRLFLIFPVSLRFSVWPLLPLHWGYKGLLLHANKLNDAQPHSVGLLWTGDQPVAETYIWQHTTLTTDSYVSSGIRTLSLSNRAAAADALGWVDTCNVTAYRNTVSWQCGRDWWPRNVSKGGYEVTLRACLVCCRYLAVASKGWYSYGLSRSGRATRRCTSRPAQACTHP
jgi:hypothetical protein